MFAATLNPSAASTVSVPSTTPSTGTCMVPRCELRMERTSKGCQIFCSCDDATACGMLQALCNTLAGGLCSVCCTRNGILVCQCNFGCCNCECECMPDGVCITCTSGDRDCCAMCQAMCDCICQCQDCGCVCTVCFNGTPVCCCTC
jgi:hypothetical protein